MGSMRTLILGSHHRGRGSLEIFPEQSAIADIGSRAKKKKKNISVTPNLQEHFPSFIGKPKLYILLILHVIPNLDKKNQ